MSKSSPIRPSSGRVVDRAPLVRRARRWLRADPRDVVLFARRTATATHPDGADPPTLRAALTAWRRAIVRRWLVALSRRWAIGALVVAVLLVLPQRLFPVVPAWPIVPILVLVLLVGVVRALRRPPSLAATARLLDHRLGLKEQLASALEVEGTAPGRVGLGARLEADATTLAGRTRREWTVHAVQAGGEWGVLAAMCALLVAAVVTPGPASIAPTAAPPPHAPLPPRPLPAPTAAPTQPPPVISVPPHPLVAVRVAVVGTTSPTTAQPRPTGGAGAATPVSGRGTAVSGAQRNTGGQAGGTTGTAAPTPRGGGTTTGENGARAGATPGRSLPPRTAFLSHNGAPPSSNRTGSASGGASRRATAGGASSRQQTTGGATGAAHQGTGTGTGKGANAGAHNQQRGSQPASGRAGAAHNQQPRGPYGYSAPLNPRYLPKPGLVTGSGSPHNARAPGSGAAGHGRGSTNGQSSSRPPTPTASGRQLSLRSAYGNAAGRDRRQTRDSTSRGAGSGTSGAPGGQEGSVTPDYVLPDANVVAPAVRAIVGQYFAPVQARTQG